MKYMIQDLKMTFLEKNKDYKNIKFFKRNLKTEKAY